MAYTAETPNLPDKALMAAAACMAALVVTPFLEHGPAALSIGLAAAGLACAGWGVVRQRAAHAEVQQEATSAHRALEELEDRLDLDAARKAMKEPGLIHWEKVKQDLGL